MRQPREIVMLVGYHLQCSVITRLPHFGGLFDNQCKQSKHATRSKINGRASLSIYFSYKWIKIYQCEFVHVLANKMRKFIMFVGNVWG